MFSKKKKKIKGNCPKNNEKIRICVDFYKVNEATICDHYLFPYIEH